MLKNGAIVIDDYMRASLPDNTVLDDVFAAGDSATVRYNPTGADDYIPLATNAVRQGLLIGENIVAATKRYPGTQPPAQCSCTIWRCPPRDSPPAARNAEASPRIDDDHAGLPPRFHAHHHAGDDHAGVEPGHPGASWVRSSCRSMTSRRRRTSCPWPFRRGSRSISSPAPTCSSSRTSANRSISSEPWPFRQWPKADPNR